MKHLYLVLLLSIGFRIAEAQTFGFLHHTIQDKQFGEINYHITDSLHEQKKPLLIFLDGSGDHPIFYYKQHEGQWALFAALPMLIAILWFEMPAARDIAAIISAITFDRKTSVTLSLEIGIEKAKVTKTGTIISSPKLWVRHVGGPCPWAAQI